MNRVMKRVQELLQTLGLTQKAKDNKMTGQDWTKFAVEYQKHFGISFEDDRKVPDENQEDSAQNATAETQQEQTPVITAEMQQQILVSLQEVATATGTESPTTAPTTIDGAMQAFIQAMGNATRTIETLAGQPEVNTPIGIVAPSATNSQELAIVLGHTTHTQTHLFGINDNFYSRGNWWNAITATRTVGESKHTTNEIAAFRDAFNSYGNDLKNRVNVLASSGQIALLNYQKMVNGELSIDYSELEKDFGKKYMVRRQDAIIAYLRTLESVAGIFPVRSGVQDKQNVTNAFFSEFSQAFQSGRVFKGGVKFTPEIYKVDDLMFKHLFDNLKDLERQYIGYLNQEGSNPMKWTFIEWLLTNIYTVLFNEQQRRRVIGVRTPIQENVDNSYALASDGVIRAIWKVIEDRKVLPFKDLKVYDESMIVDYYEELWEKVLMILPSMTGMRMYANKKHRSWFLKDYRKKYSKDGDFTGTKDNLTDLSPESIIWVPNMDMNDYLVWITVPGNVENYELTPGEMYAVYFEQDLETLISASWWKEGSGLQMAGLKCATTEELEKTGRKFQYIFTNYPVTVLGDGETTIDALKNTVFETSANSAATKITDIENVSKERVYKIICGSMTNKTTIDKSGKFAKINAAWTPGAVGDYMIVYAELKKETQTIDGKQVQVTVPSGNFLELERRVTT